MRLRRQPADAAWSSDAPSFLRHWRRNHLLDVLGENVELKIYKIAARCMIKVGMTLGVGNDPDGEAFRKNFRNGRLIPLTVIEPLEAT